ncbi:MAG: DUF1800 domain-containing protein [Gammaproteobacteria bacterium]
MQEPFAAAIAANRFGLGARPGELDRIGGDARDWLIAQLKGPLPALADSGLRSSESVLVETLELRREKRDAPGGKRAAGRPDAGAAAAAVDSSADANVRAAAIQNLLKLPQLYRPIYIDEATARLRHAATTDRPFVERITQFWTNHFAVSIDKIAVLGLAGAFEREAIRPHVLGNFTDLLLAVEQHPAMLLYLDNYLSVGPDSRAAQIAKRRQRDRKIGINENLAREILELHTLGVSGGYTQQDVTTFAEVITGWSIGGNFGRLKDGVPGRFTFRELLHEPGAKTVLGKRYAQSDESQGEAVLRDVAAKPATAHFIATKLARHFIADDPPPAAVERLSKAFSNSRGDLPSVYRALVEMKDSWAEPLAKYKTPTDYIVSSYRALDLPVDASRRGLASFELLGQRTYSPGSPAGWPDRSADWDGASALMKRIEWADAVGQRVGTRHNAADLAPQLLGATLGDDTRKAISRAASGAQALTLLLTAPEFLRR